MPDCRTLFQKPALIWARRTWHVSWANSRTTDSLTLLGDAAATLRNTSRRSRKRSKAKHRASSATPTDVRVRLERGGTQRHARKHGDETTSSVWIAAVHSTAGRFHHDRRTDQCRRFAQVREVSQRKQVRGSRKHCPA